MVQIQQLELSLQKRQVHEIVVAEELFEGVLGLPKSSWKVHLLKLFAETELLSSASDWRVRSSR